MQKRGNKAAAAAGPVQQIDVPVIALADLNGYLSKPFNPRELSGIMQRTPAAPRKQSEPSTTADTSDCDTVFDRDGLIERLDHDRELIEMVLNTFLQNFNNKLEKLKKAFSENNAKNVRLHGHSIKGVAANVGAVNIQNLGFRIEQAGASGELHTVTALVDDITKEYAAFKKVALDFLNNA